MHEDCGNIEITKKNEGLAIGQTLVKESFTLKPS